MPGCKLADLGYELEDAEGLRYDVVLINSALAKLMPSTAVSSQEEPRMA